MILCILRPYFFVENDFFKFTHPTKVRNFPHFFWNLPECFCKKKESLFGLQPTNIVEWFLIFYHISKTETITNWESKRQDYVLRETKEGGRCAIIINPLDKESLGKLLSQHWCLKWIIRDYYSNINNVYYLSSIL